MLKFKCKVGEKNHDIEAESGSTLIIELKSKLEHIAEIPSASQKWIYKGRILSDETSVSQANINAGDTVIVMKAAASSKSSQSTSSPPLPSGNSSANQQPSPASVTQPSAASSSSVYFDRAMHVLLNNPVDSVKNAVGVLAKIVSNIVSFPMEEKYRRLNSKNAAFSKKLGSVTGGNYCMQTLGFQLVNDEWVLEPHADAWDNLLRCKVKLDKFVANIATVDTEKLASDPPHPAISTPAPATAVVVAPVPPLPSSSVDDAALAQQLLLAMLLQASGLQATSTLGAAVFGDAQPGAASLSNPDSSVKEAGGNSLAAGAGNTGESSGPDETAQNEGDVSVSKTEEAGGGGGDGKSGDGYEDPFAGL